MNVILEIREATNCPLHICKHAYGICQDKEIAIEFLQLKYSAVSRRKIENGIYVNFNDNDYLNLAKKNLGI